MLKGIGALCVMLGASVMGFGYAAAVRRQGTRLAALIGSLTYMKGEIEYRRTPLPEVFLLLADSAAEKCVGRFWQHCAEALARGTGFGVQSAFRAAMRKSALELPPEAVQTMLVLGTSLGQFGLEGQERAIALSIERLAALLERLEQGRAARCRSYATIGVCAGLAVAVILL